MTARAAISPRRRRSRRATKASRSRPSCSSTRRSTAPRTPTTRSRSGSGMRASPASRASAPTPTGGSSFIWATYVPDPAARKASYASPLHAESVHGLAPAVIITAEHDFLRGEAEDYARRLEAAGVPVELHEYAGQIHGFFEMFTVMTDAHHAVGVAGDAVRRAFQSADPITAFEGVLVRSLTQYRGTVQVAAVAAAGALLLAGCAPGGSADAGPEPSKPVTTGVGSEPVTLKLLVTSGVDVPFFTALGELFHAKYGNVTVKVEQPGLRRPDHEHRAHPRREQRARPRSRAAVRQPDQGPPADQPRPVRQGVRVGQVAAVAVRLHPRRARWQATRDGTAVRRRTRLRPDRGVLQQDARAPDRHDAAAGNGRRVRAVTRQGEGRRAAADHDQRQGRRQRLPAAEPGDVLRRRRTSREGLDLRQARREHRQRGDGAGRHHAAAPGDMPDTCRPT